MDDGVDQVDLLAAEAGDVVAMDKVGVSFFNQGLTEEGQRWLTKAAESGSEAAMTHLGVVLMRTGDIEGAEHWLGIAAASGDATAMYNLAYILRSRDVVAAEVWSRKAAEAGNSKAMFGLGSLLLDRGDLAGAEGWFHRAADSGNDRALERMGKVLEDRGDPEGAAVWYHRAVETGDTGAMLALGDIAKNNGDVDGAAAWFQRAANGGDNWSHYKLGLLFLERGDGIDAEVQFRLAAEGGVTPAMDNLGCQLQARGALDEALDWYLRGADAGSSFATDAIPLLRENIKADGMLDSINFDTFGWEKSSDVNGITQWRSPDGGQLVERYFDFPPDHDSWDAEDIRTQALDMLGFVASPTFRREDLPDAVQKYLPTELPEQISLLDVDLFKVGPAKCVQMASRHRGHSGVHYALSITVMFAECFWVLGIELSEGPVIGEREGAVARSVLEDSTTTLPEFDPYERRWDGIVPIEDDPLTRLRMLALQLRESIALGDNLVDLDPFIPVDE